MSIERTPLGHLLYEKRMNTGMSIVDVCAAIKEMSREGKCLNISSSYYCQVEGNLKRIDKISLDFLWAVGIVLGVDPLELYLLSRPQLDQRFLDKAERERLFRDGFSRKVPTRHLVILPGPPLRFLTARGEWTTNKDRAKTFSYRGSAMAALKRQQRQGWDKALLESFEA